jgi:hypothetical protein
MYSKEEVPIDFCASSKIIPTSQDLWAFRFLLSKLREWNCEAFFAFQPESCLFSFALW